MGKPGIVHDFKTSLEYSEIASDEEFWSSIYRKAFPNMVNHMTAFGDTESQRQGIDRVIILSNGKILKIDEKKRKKDYGDILLEYISNDQTGALGWIEKDLSIDYLAYAFMPSEKVYLFPWLMLRRSWLHYKDEWISTYPYISADNLTYNTISVAVPIDTLLSAVKIASIIQV